MAKIKRERFKKVPLETPVSELTPLNIQCGTTKCESDLHCFRLTKAQIKKHGQDGVCKECGKSLVDWKRLHKNNIRDVEYTFKAMQNELIRHVYWHTPIEKQDRDSAISKGRAKVEQEVQKRMVKDIGIEKPFRGGYTPYTGDVIYYAQHATGTCCRRCMEYWHHIPVGRVLTPKEITYTQELIILYLKERVPELFENVNEPN
jgi:hypothetical protein